MPSIERLPPVTRNCDWRTFRMGASSPGATRACIHNGGWVCMSACEQGEEESFRLIRTLMQSRAPLVTAGMPPGATV
jgi:hypothetical protein